MKCILPVFLDLFPYRVILCCWWISLRKFDIFKRFLCIFVPFFSWQQTVTGISQISFSAEGSVSPKKPSSLPEVAKQRELSGTLESEADAKLKKQNSEAKSKELSGSDIFGPPPEVPSRPLAARNLELQGNLDFALPQPRSIHTSVKVSNVSEMKYILPLNAISLLRLKNVLLI